MKLSFFIPYNQLVDIESIKKYGTCHLLTTEDLNCDNKVLIKDSLFSSDTIKSIFEIGKDSDYIVFITQPVNISFSDDFISKLDYRSLFCYSDYIDKNKGEIRTIDYQKGSIRDNFSFGPVLFFKAKEVYNISKELSNSTYSALYELILRVSEICLPSHVNEYAYTASSIEYDNRKSGEKQFDYQNPKNRNVQIEYERIATEHLKRIGAFIDHGSISEISQTINFEVEASVIIPVYNRERTIADAIKSALSQKTEFNYNVIVVDNHSSDSTTSIIDDIAKSNKNLIHIIPEEDNLKIGGCWNKALNSQFCGKYAIQLDSDDIYSDEFTVQTIVDKFKSENCAMVIGSYKITNFNLQDLPPGIIDHKEWTDDNGMNNALRINGLGAPRAFYTPVARQIQFINCSYGEDYAMGLAISRAFKIGRIYNILYICRRWEGNSDADLTLDKENANNFSKDAMRTQEIEKRILLNKLSRKS